MKVIDTNALIILLLGLIDPKLINNHSRTSIYEEQDFYELMSFIGDIGNLIVLPNVWTEVDNLLNNFNRGLKERYVEEILMTIKLASERYLESKVVIDSIGFFELGITDTLLLELSKNCDSLITSDSRLSDYALAFGIHVFDVVKNRNQRI